jgi:phenylpropionate dioxygenase-like ring-hydroxylating dioxygenase large terminal subunit
MALSEGTIIDGSLECPYHGWRYRGDGKCIHIPAFLPDTAQPCDIAIRSYPVTESDGYMWVYMGSKIPAQPPRPFPHCGEPGWTTFRMKTRFDAGAFSCLENFLDCPHTVYVHRKWFRNSGGTEVRAEVTTGSDSVQVEFFDERDAKSLVSKLLFPRGRRMKHTDRFLMPTTSRVDYIFGPDRHFIITSQCTPGSEAETEVYTVITFRFGRIAPSVRLFFEPLARRIIRQDVTVLKAQTEQLRHFGGADFTFVETDLIGPHILRLWHEAIAPETNGKRNEPEISRATKQEVLLRF